MRGTGVGRWEAGYDEAICAVTDLPPEQVEVAWYQARFWIEDDYKDGKRGWFHWEHTKMTDAGRASRLWMVLALAMHKAIGVGEQWEAKEQEAQKRQPRRPGGSKRRPGRPCP